MAIDESQPTLLERLAANTMQSLQHLGLSKLAYSSMLRGLAKNLIIRADRGPRVRAIASGLGKGLKLRVTPETPKSYWMGTHEPSLQVLIREEIKSGMTVYDCGANVGYFSVIFARLVGPLGRVFAFEPSPSSLECLRMAGSLNHLNNLTAVPAAVWDKSAVLCFLASAANGSLVGDHVEGIFETSAAKGPFLYVPAISMDEFVYMKRNQSPDFIKIDVEGAEGKALRGAHRLLSEHRPRLFLEIHGEPGREVWSLLKELNYVSTDVVTGKVAQSTEEFAIWIRQYLAVPV